MSSKITKPATLLVFIALILLSVGSAKAQDKDTAINNFISGIEKEDRVVLYVYNISEKTGPYNFLENLSEFEPIDSFDISNSYTQLADSLRKPSEYGVFCFIPHHVIMVYDANGKLKDYLLICISCSKMLLHNNTYLIDNPAINDYFEKMGFYTSHQIRDLFDKLRKKKLK